MTDTEYDKAVWHITAQYVADFRAGRKPTLHDYLARYPLYASPIADFVAYFLAVEAEQTDASLAYLSPHPDGQRILERSLRPMHVPPEPMHSLLPSQSSSLSLSTLASQLDMSEDVLFLLERRVLAVESIPSHLFERLAFLLHRSEEEVRRFFSSSAKPQKLPQLFVAEEPATFSSFDPSLPLRSFLQALEESTLATTEQKIFWRSIIAHEQQDNDESFS